MASFTTTLICPTQWPWVWSNSLTILLPQEITVEGSSISVPLLLTNQLGLITLLLKVKWTEKGEEVLTRTTISPPSPLFPHLLYALRDFKGAGIWSYSYIDYSGLKKRAFQQKQFFACEVGVCRVERGSSWWSGEGACDVGRGAAST